MIKKTATAALILVAFGLGACDLLDVQNPNSLQESQLNDPTASQAMANGLKASITRALSFQFAAYGMATDELTWIGSRDAWQELDFGNIGNQLNEFSDQAFPYMAEAEWHAREYIGRLEGFKNEGTLPSDQILAEAYLWAAITYTSLADQYDNYAKSDKLEPGEPLTESGMKALYGTALDWVTSAQELDAGLQTRLKAMEARIRVSRSLWEKVHPTNDVQTGDAALVQNAEAANAAQQALSLMQTDARFELPNPTSSTFENYLAQQVNGRQEMRPGDTYVSAKATDNTVDEVTFQDVVDEVVHPFTRQVIRSRYSNQGNNFAPITYVSAREMHLIVAEHELASGNPAGFDEAINSLRALDDELSSYDGPSTEGVSRIDLLENSRQANLYLQGRRLKDLYRFDEQVETWLSDSDVVQEPGTFFPITATEVRANPNLEFND
jgi:hypothetical protein